MPEERKPLFVVVCRVMDPCVLRIADRTKADVPALVQTIKAHRFQVCRTRRRQPAFLEQFARGGLGRCLTAFDPTLDQLHARKRMPEHQNLRNACDMTQDDGAGFGFQGLIRPRAGAC